MKPFLSSFIIIIVVFCFRWVKPAASLKHVGIHYGIPSHVPGFRWVKPAASLKQHVAGVGQADLRLLVSAG